MDASAFNAAFDAAVTAVIVAGVVIALVCFGLGLLVGWWLL